MSKFLISRYIKLSSPKLNNVAVVGCMLVYSGIIILGFDESLLEEAYFRGICTVIIQCFFSSLIRFLFAGLFMMCFFFVKCGLWALFTHKNKIQPLDENRNQGRFGPRSFRSGHFGMSLLANIWSFRP